MLFYKILLDFRDKNLYNKLIINSRSERLKIARERLLSYRSLKKGWFDSEMNHGEPISIDLIREVSRGFIENFTIIPEVFPLCDGGIQIEWTLDSNIYLEIELWKPEDCNHMKGFIADSRFEHSRYFQFTNFSQEKVNELLKEFQNGILSEEKLEKYTEE